MISARQFYLNLPDYDPASDSTSIELLKARDAESFALGAEAMKKKILFHVQERIALWYGELSMTKNQDSILYHRYDARESEGLIIKSIIAVCGVDPPKG